MTCLEELQVQQVICVEKDHFARNQDQLSLLLVGCILQVLDQVVCELYVASQWPEHLVVDGRREVCELFALLLLLCESLKGSDVAEIDDLAGPVVERKVESLDDQGMVLFAAALFQVQRVGDHCVAFYALAQALWVGLLLDDLLQIEELVRDRSIG